MNMKASQVNEKRWEILNELKSWEGEIVGVSKLADLLDRDSEATRRLVKRMHDDGLVNYESSYSGSRITLTSDGKKIEENAPYPRGNVGGDVGAEELKRLHGFTVEARIMSDCPSEWVGVLQGYDELSILKDEGNDTIAARDKWVIRLHKESVTFQLREGCSLSANTAEQVFREAYSQVQHVGAWLEGAAGVRLQMERFKITHAELGFEGHPLAELAGDLPGVPLDRFSVVDPDLQKEALGIDGSPAEHEELEPKSERTEGIAQTIEDEMQQYVERPDAVSKRHGFENELSLQEVSPQKAVHNIRKVSDVEEVAREAKSDAEENKDELRSAGEALNRIQDNREAEKDTRDAFMEQVRSINNLAQSNQRVLEKIQEGRERDREIIERQEEQIEKQSEIIEALQQELEDLRDSKSLEQRVRDRFEKASGFSSVHEHSNPGNDSLYVWDNTGESPEYRKVLDESMRDRPLVQVSRGSRDSSGGVVHG